jgi:hypothetical protein
MLHDIRKAARAKSNDRRFAKECFGGYEPESFIDGRYDDRSRLLITAHEILLVELTMPHDSVADSKL